MPASVRNFEHAARVQFDRAEKAEQQAEDIHHALNLLLNSGFERFHMGLTADGAVHYFELGTVRDVPVADWQGLPIKANGTRTRRIILWRTMFSQGHFYASAFHEPKFRTLPGNLEPGSGLRNLLEHAIEMIPTATPFLITDDSAPI